MNKNWIIGLVLMLTLAGTAAADEGNSTNNSTNSTANNTIESDTIQGQALEVRYEHLICKVEFTNEQIDLLDKYIQTDVTGLEDSKDTLNDYMEVLEGYVEDNNKTAFNIYLEQTFRPEFSNVTRELNTIKSNFRQYNLSNDTREDFKDDLKDLKEEYADCVNDKELQMGKVMNKHIENWNKQYEHNIQKMSRNRLNTTEMDAIIANMSARNAELEALIESGNITKLKEFMNQFREESMYFATKMEIETLRSYKSGLYEESEKYNKTAKAKSIDKHLENAEKYSRQGQDDAQDYEDEENYNHTWENIREANKEMKELSKDILKERAREHAESEESDQGNGRGRE